ncbi:MAG TPA: hypothetical protein VFK37_05140, partial [Bacillales bacterium]|nr:hypothetical protein [Bacillales bacterium]
CFAGLAVYDWQWRAATGLIDPKVQRIDSKSVMPTTRKLGQADPKCTVKDSISLRNYSIIFCRTIGGTQNGIQMKTFSCSLRNQFKFLLFANFIPLPTSIKASFAFFLASD